MSGSPTSFYSALTTTLELHMHIFAVLLMLHRGCVRNGVLPYDTVGEKQNASGVQ